MFYRGIVLHSRHLFVLRVPTMAAVLSLFSLCPSNRRLKPAAQESQYKGLATSIFGGRSDVPHSGQCALPVGHSISRPYCNSAPFSAWANFALLLSQRFICFHICFWRPKRGQRDIKTRESSWCKSFVDCSLTLSFSVFPLFWNGAQRINTWENKLRTGHHWNFGLIDSSEDLSSSDCGHSEHRVRNSKFWVRVSFT